MIWMTRNHKIILFFRLSRYQHVSQLWCSRQLDTFHYLAILNSLGGRSSEDLSQYPVMPWTYIDFTSNDVDLDDLGRYRNLRFPVGAINAKCLAFLQQRLAEISEMTAVTTETLNTTSNPDLGSGFNVSRSMAGNLAQLIRRLARRLVVFSKN